MANQRKNTQDFSKLDIFDDVQQEAIFQMMVEDKDFSSKCRGKIDANSFRDPDVRRLANLYITNTNNGVSIDFDTLGVLVRTEIQNAIDREKCEAFLKRIRENSLSNEARSILKSTLDKRFIALEAVRLCGTIEELCRSSKGTTRDEVIGKVETFKKRTNIGECVMEKPFKDYNDIISVISEGDREHIPTGCYSLDWILFGGLKRCDVGLIQAGSGVAKTCFTTAIAMEAAKKGYKVAHIVLEDKANDIKRKYICNYCNINEYELYNDRQGTMNKVNSYFQGLNATMSNIRNVFACKTGRMFHNVSLNDIDRELESQVNSGFKPDLIIVDYFDRITPEAREQWNSDEIITNGLLNIANKYNAALWCPTQGTKAAQGKNAELDASTMKGGSWRIYGAQVAISLKPNDDNMPNTLSLTVDKCRYGTAMRTAIVGFDRGRCRFFETQADADFRNVYGNFEHNQLNVAKEVNNG